MYFPAVSHIFRAIDKGLAVLGSLAAWSCLLMTLIVSLIVLLRYGFNEGAIALQEAVTYLHAIFIMCGIAYTLQQDAHVRVDVFYRGASEKYRLWINALGHIVFLLPFCVFILFNSADFVSAAWKIREGSAEAGGIDAVFLLKALIPVMAITLMLQSLSNCIRCAYQLITGEPVSSD